MRRKAVDLLLRKADMRDTGGHKEYKYLYQRMLDEEVIRKAYKKLRKGKTKRNEIIYIDAHTRGTPGTGVSPAQADTKDHI